MEGITRIVIESCSGYCSADCAYEDKLTLTANRIAYKCKPYLEAGQIIPIEWSYRVDSPVFQSYVDRIAKMVEEKSFWLNIPIHDAGTTTLSVFGGRKRIWSYCEYGCPVQFRDVFDVIQRLVPPIEVLPLCIDFFDSDMDDETEE